MADSHLAFEHLTGHMSEMIPWFAGTYNGHPFLLTKSGIERCVIGELPHLFCNGRCDDNLVIAQELLDDDMREDRVIFDEQDTHDR